MPKLEGARPHNWIVEFTPEIRIKKTDLDMAIAGGMKRAGLERAGTQLRDEIRSTVYLDLVSYFFREQTSDGKLSSLAYKIAYHVSVDTFRRPDRYDRRRASNVDVVDATPGAGVEMGLETAEARILRLSETRIMARTLAAALNKVSPTDRNALIGMLERREPLPRETLLERKIANAIAQREKRARDRLREAVGSTRASER